MLCQRGNFQVVSTALSQTDDASKGLDYISKLLVRFRVIEVTYDLSEHPDSRYTASKKLCELHEQLREEFISLYAEIIGYQFYLSKHHTHNQFSRLFRNAVIPDDWKDMASSIEQRKINRRHLGNAAPKFQYSHQQSSIQCKPECGTNAGWYGKIADGPRCKSNHVNGVDVDSDKSARTISV